MTVTVGDTSDDIAASPETLTFTTANWNTAQTVTVTADDDSIAEGQETATLTHAVSGYGTVTTADSVTVTIADNDTAGVTVSPTAVEATEGGVTGSYTVVLTSQPTGTVTVTVGDTSDDIAASPETLTFTTVNWNTAQTVTVTADDDSIAEGEETATLTHSVSGYGTVTTADSVTVTIADNDTAGVTVSPTAVEATEGGVTGSYTVVLTSQPTGTVTVTVGDTSDDIAASPETLTFTTANWNTAQTVTVTADDDSIAEDEETATLTHAVSGYGTVTTADSVTVTIADNDTAGVAVSPTAVEATEGGVTGSYTVVLTSQPTGTVTVTVGDTSDDIAASPETLTFTTANWNTAQTVTVTADDDSIAEDEETATLTHAVSGYGTVTTADSVTVTIADNDTAGVTVSPTAVEATEGGVTGSYTVVLTSQPTGTVTVTVGDTSDDIAASPETLTFTTANWNTAQTVTVTADDDSIAEDEETATLTHSVSGYGTVTTADSVTVTIADNDTAGVTVSPTAVTATEGGATGSYTVVLTTQPTGTVTVTVGDTSDDISASPSSLTFTTVNWNTAQTVTVTADDDSIAEGEETATLTHAVTSTDSDYSGLSVDSVTVTVEDNDTTERIFDPGWYAPTITSPTCGSSITIEDGMGGYNEVAISLSWGSTVTPTGIYWFMEGHRPNEVEGRQTDTATFTVTPRSTWLEEDSRIEITIVGETATAKYPQGTGPGTKVVFTPQSGSTDSAECETQVPGIATGLSVRSAAAGPRYVIGDRDSTIYIKRSDPGDETAPELLGAVVNGATLTLTFGEALDEDSVPPAGAFAVAVDGASRAVDSVGLSGGTAVLTLVSPAASGEAATVDYTPPAGTGATPLRDAAGNAVAGFTGHAATNETPAPVKPGLTARFESVPSSHDRSTAFTFELHFSEEVAIGYRTVRDSVLEVTGGTVKRALRLEKGSNLGWRIRVRSTTDGDVTVVLPADRACGEPGAVCTGDGRRLSNRLELRIAGPASVNTAPTGLPAISGTARVGETLTASVTGIADADGLTSATFAYQWLSYDGATDTDIQGATGTGYTLVAADQGKTVKVRVTFTDGGGTQESLVSEATAPVAAEPAEVSIATVSPILVPENATAVATLQATDADTPVESLSWSVEGGADAGAFTLTSDGVLGFGTAKDFEAPDDADTDGDYEVTVRVTDGANAAEAALTVRLVDVDDVAPVLSDATANGEVLTLTFSEALDGGSVPPAGAFTVEVDGAGAVRVVDTVTLTGDEATLTLASPVAADETVTVGYTPPAGPGATLLRDAAGNAVAGFSGRAVTNETPAPVNTAPTGLPAISGTARVGETLTASVTGIADADGLTSATFAYQWLSYDGATDTEIQGATGTGYTLVAADAGKTVKVRVTFTDGGGTQESLVSEATVAVAVAAEPAEVSIAAAASPVTEGAAAAFTLSRGGDAAAALTVAVRVSEAGAVLAGAAPAAVTFEAGASTATLTLATLDDGAGEADARVTATVVPGAGYRVAAGTGTAGIDVFDNDAAPAAPAVVTVWSGDLAVADFGTDGGYGAASADGFSNAQGSAAVGMRWLWYWAPERTLYMALARPLADSAELALHLGGVAVALADGGSGNSFTWTGVDLDWTGGETVAVRLTKEGDGAVETPSGAAVSVADAQVREAPGAVLAFRVRLDAAQTTAVSVRYATSDATAAAGSDYVAGSGAVRFAPGATERTVHVRVLEDAHDEGAETLHLALLAPVRRGAFGRAGDRDHRQHRPDAEGVACALRAHGGDPGGGRGDVAARGRGRLARDGGRAEPRGGRRGAGRGREARGRGASRSDVGLASRGDRR